MSLCRETAYHRAELLGAGGFGSVRLVYDDDGEVFAAKMLEPDEDGSLNVGAFREVSLLRLLQGNYGHENVLPLADLTEMDEMLCLVLPKRPLSLAKALKCDMLADKPARLKAAHGLLCGVRFMHHNGLIHRDIKPDNVMLDDQGTAQLIDFSLSKQLPEGALAVGATHTGNVGTACYIAPEVYYQKPYSFLADVYSTGVVMMEMVTGRLPETVARDKAAFQLVQKRRDGLPPAKPMPDLLRQMLDEAPDKRCSAEQALASPLWAKNGLTADSPRLVIGDAMAARAPTAVREATERAAAAKGGKKRKRGGKQAGSEVKDVCRLLEVQSDQAVRAAELYQAASGCAAAACALLGMKMYDSEMLELEEAEELLQESWDEEFDAEQYCEAEKEILKAMNYCLFV